MGKVNPLQLIEELQQLDQDIETEVAGSSADGVDSLRDAAARLSEAIDAVTTQLKSLHEATSNFQTVLEEQMSVSEESQDEDSDEGEE